MNPVWIVWPQLAHMALTMALLIWLGRLRVQAARSGKVRLGDIAITSDAWPVRVQLVGNNYKSQFELPVLFHLLCVLIMMQGPVHIAFAGLAWLFVLSRLAHSFIHVTSNHVIRRFQMFLAGVLILSLMGAGLAAQLILKA